MFRLASIFAVMVSIVNAQREVNLGDVEAAAQAYHAAGDAYLAAASAAQTGAASSKGGCLRDMTTGECV
eukprot:CAMPEP_0178995120 /NCGR_PEP_ID=MMETSP0795-20121207/7665_1 /TAXON_ID=88552 /ORGANISM="Amoebophrya sp., Strain Ameob2" /LENGTH=68 /DNA_ID=CAMNT_0020687421 /DNA_START=32 /DNA_END=234 /DNA_ORIENTATION=+